MQPASQHRAQFRTHACSKQRLYSITSSARASNEGGTVSPSALADFGLSTSSNLVGLGIAAGKKLLVAGARKQSDIYYLCILEGSNKQLSLAVALFGADKIEILPTRK